MGRIERGRWLGIWVTVQVEMVPTEGPGLFCPAAGQLAKSNLVDRVVTRRASADLTSAAFRSLSFAAPMSAVSGANTSRFVETVFADRPSSP